MIKLLIFFLIVTLISLGFAWFADRPGNILIEWQGYEIETSFFVAVGFVGLLIALTLFIWSLVRNLITSPTNISNYFNRRKREKGLEAISGGMIAVAAGDPGQSQRYALQARRALPNEPLTDLLRAQSARIGGDHATARRIYEAMLASPETELSGLHGLFLEAKRENELEPASQYSERALRINPALEWASSALFDLQCRAGKWNDAAKTLEIAKSHGHVSKKIALRRRAILLTAQAIEQEEDSDADALNLALEAHKNAPDLIPAAEIAGRILASQGSTAKAARIIQETWKRSPHPDLALTYAYARPGDSPVDRLERVRQLASLTPNNIEAPIAIATAAIEAHEWPAARAALEPLLEKRLTSRICVLMAHIEGGQYGDKGRVREWLARAVHAPRDPTWTADGYVSENWLPVSPINGEIDSFTWQVPIDSIEEKDSNRLLEQLNVLAADALIEARPAESIAEESSPIDSSEPITVEATPVPTKDIYEAQDDTPPASAQIEETDEYDLSDQITTEAGPNTADENTEPPIILADQSASEEQPAAPEEPVENKSADADNAKDQHSDAPIAPKKPEETRPAQKTADPKSGEVPTRLRSLPPPSPEIAPTSEPRIFVSPRPPDDPGPDPVD